MLSCSKVKLNRSDIERIMRKVFGSKTRVVSVKENNEGWFNALYAVSLQGLPDVFLKVAPPPELPVLRYEKGLLATEVEVLKIFEKNPEIPSPSVFFADFGKELINTDYFVMEKLEGESLFKIKDSIDAEVLKRINIHKGQINQAINSIHGEQFGIFGSEHEKFGNWQSAFLGMVDDILADAEDFGVEMPFSLSRIRSFFSEFADDLDFVTRPCLVHWDLHDGNILIKDKNSIAGIIDCDRALWGDPAIEYYFSRMFPSPEEFFQGYGLAVWEEDSFVSRRNMYDLYLTLIFVTECRSRDIKDSEHIKWAHGMLNSQIKKFL